MQTFICEEISKESNIVEALSYSSLAAAQSFFKNNQDARKVLVSVKSAQQISNFFIQTSSGKVVRYEG